jgi:hypothetical protein
MVVKKKINCVINVGDMIVIICNKVIEYGTIHCAR